MLRVRGQRKISRPRPRPDTLEYIKTKNYRVARKQEKKIWRFPGFFSGPQIYFRQIIATKSKCNKDSLGRNESSVSGVQSSNFEATRPTSMRPTSMRPKPDATRPRPNNLASRPHRPRGLNIPALNGVIIRWWFAQLVTWAPGGARGAGAAGYIDVHVWANARSCRGSKLVPQGSGRVTLFASSDSFQ